MQFGFFGNLYICITKSVILLRRELYNEYFDQFTLSKKTYLFHNKWMEYYKYLLNAYNMFYFYFFILPDYILLYKFLVSSFQGHCYEDEYRRTHFRLGYYK